MSEPSNKLIKLVGSAPDMQALVTSKKMVEAFENANHLGYARIRQSFLTACIKQPKLYQCDITSVVDAILKAVAYNLETDGVMGRAFLIPRWNGYKGCQECVFQIGYKGLIEFFYRASPGGVVGAGYACEKDTFTYSLGTDPFVTLVKGNGDRGDITHFYAYYQLASGRRDVEVMTVDEMVDFCQEFRSDKNRTNNANYKGVWDSHFGSMGTKTVAARLMKRAPQSPELAKALAEDEYLQSGSFSIEQAGDDPTQTKLVPNNEPSAAPAPAATPVDAQPSRRMKLGKKPQAAGAPPTTEHPSAPAPAASLCPACNMPLINGECFDCLAAAQPRTPEKAMKSAVNAVSAAVKESLGAPPLPLEVQEELAELQPPEIPEVPPAPPLSAWQVLSDEDVIAKWSGLSKPDRDALWAALSTEDKKHISGAINRHQNKASAVDDPELKAATDLINRMDPDAQLKWLGVHMPMVPASIGAAHRGAAGIDSKNKTLQGQAVDAVNRYAISTARYLMKDKVMTLQGVVNPAAGPTKAGRPGPR